MLFSVVIPVYNRSAVLEDTLRSISAQVFRDFEVIIVDDGSSDDVGTDLRKSGYRVLTQTNSGPSAARNAGASAARGDYLAFIDSDDVWFPWSLANYARVITEYSRPAFVTGRHALFNDIAELSDFADGAIETVSFDDYYSSQAFWLWFGVSSFVVRRDVFQAVGGFSDVRANGEDADLAMRLGISKGFVHLSSPVSFGYRVHSGNITNNTLLCRKGIELLLNSESTGVYPGGPERRMARQTIISRHARAYIAGAASRGELLTVMRFSYRLLPELLRSCRWRFLLGIPFVTLAGIFRRCFFWLGR